MQLRPQSSIRGRPSERERTDDARAIIDRYLGGEEHMVEADYGSDTRNESGWRQLFARGMRARTFFVCTFYICVVTPYFAIFTFAPKVFESLKLNEMAGTIFANGIAFFGAIAGMLTIERVGRRSMHPPTPLPKQRVQRHLLGQRMLEGVFGDRIERLLDDEIAILQNAQRRAKFRFLEQRMADLVDHAPQNRLGKVVADHRRRLQDKFLALAEAIYASRQKRLHIRGYL